MDNLESGRYKTCGHGHPYYNQDGHYDEVACDLAKGYFCGDSPCPLDEQGITSKNDGWEGGEDDNAAEEYEKEQEEPDPEDR